MVLLLGRGLPTARPGLSGGSGIGQEAADLHRDEESHGMGGRNKLPLPLFSPCPTTPRDLPGESE